ncbi:MAG: hypothetical protein WA008_06085 [Saprospiraceae bacterium]
MEDFITGIIGWFVIITIVTTAYRLIKYKSLSNFPMGKIILWSIILPCIALIPMTISYLTRPSQQELQQAKIVNQQKYDQELDTISRLLTKNIFINNSPYYDKTEIMRIKNSSLYDDNFKLYWRAYFIYFLEDLDSSRIEKTKVLGRKRNEVEAQMLGKIITQNDLDIINKLQNDFVYSHKVLIQNKYYSDKEYIDSLISWHFYHNDDKDYGLKIFKD